MYTVHICVWPFPHDFAPFSEGNFKSSNPFQESSPHILTWNTCRVCNRDVYHLDFCMITKIHSHAQNKIPANLFSHLILYTYCIEALGIHLLYKGGYPLHYASLLKGGFIGSNSLALLYLGKFCKMGNGKRLLVCLIKDFPNYFEKNTSLR